MVFKYWIALLITVLLFILLFFSVGCARGEQAASKSAEQTAIFSKGGQDKSTDNSFRINLSGSKVDPAMLSELMEQRRIAELEKLKVQQAHELWKLSIIALGIITVFALFMKSPLEWFKK